MPTKTHNPRQSLASAPRQRVIAPEFQQALFVPPAGTTWLRILPPHATSKVPGWLYTFQVYDLAPRSAGFIPEIAVPESLVGVPATSNPIAVFGRFLDANYSHLTRARGVNNERPLGIFPKDRAICAVHVAKTTMNARDELPVRFWYSSHYRGNENLRPGPLRVLDDLCTEEKQEFGGGHSLRYGDLSHPDTGRLISINIERGTITGFRFNGIQVDETTPAPIENFAKYYAAMPAFARLNVPVENVVRCPSEAEMFEVLENYIGWQVRNGYVSEEAYEAYAQCFGREVAPERRVSAAARPIASSASTATRVEPPSIVVPPSPPAQVEEAKTRPQSRIVDDLDDTAPVAPPPPASPAPTPEPPSKPAASTGNPALDLQRASKEQLVQALRDARARKEFPISTEMKAVRRTLLMRHVSQLSPADFEVINAFADPKFGS